MIERMAEMALALLLLCGFTALYVEKQREAPSNPFLQREAPRNPFPQREAPSNPFPQREAPSNPFPQREAPSNPFLQSPVSSQQPMENFRLQALAERSNISLEELESLEEILNRAKMHDGTVILTTFNEAWARKGSMLDLFIKSFRTGNGTEKLLEYLVIIAMDSTSYKRCLRLPHVHCFALKTTGVDFSGEKLFRTKDYFEMMWRRTYFLGVVLELGYSFVFTDSDILWLQNPFQHLHSDVDLEITCDKFRGNEADHNRNFANTGFLHLVPNNRTIKMYELWYRMRLEFPDHNEQDVFQEMRHRPEFSELQLKVRYLSTDLFSGFCEMSKDVSKVCTLHANCCVGLTTKMEVLRLAVKKRNRYLRLKDSSKRQPWRGIHC